MQHTDSHLVELVDTGNVALYLICPAFVVGSSRPIHVFMDSGSNASYITNACAQRMKLKKLGKVTLKVTTVGGDNKGLNSIIYEVPLRDADSKVRKLMSYGLPKITGQLSPLKCEVLVQLFPSHDPGMLMPATTMWTCWLEPTILVSILNKRLLEQERI